jgi:hypothetical protein
VIAALALFGSAGPSQAPLLFHIQLPHAPDAELLLLLEDSTALDAKVEEAVSVSASAVSWPWCCHAACLSFDSTCHQHCCLQVLKQHQAIPDGAVVREKGQ